MDKQYTEVVKAEDVTQEILDIAEGITDGWYADTRIDWDDIWDRMDNTPLNDNTYLSMGSEMGTPAMKKIQKHIRDLRKQG